MEVDTHSDHTLNNPKETPILEILACTTCSEQFRCPDMLNDHLMSLHSLNNESRCNDTEETDSCSSQTETIRPFSPIPASEYSWRQPSAEEL